MSYECIVGTIGCINLDKNTPQRCGAGELYVTSDNNTGIRNRLGHFSLLIYGSKSNSFCQATFTLIELLIIISIIVILTGIFLPSLQKAKMKTFQIYCANNQRQIGNAINFYVNDFDSYYPPMLLNHDGYFWYYAMQDLYNIKSYHFDCKGCANSQPYYQIVMSIEFGRSKLIDQNYDFKKTSWFQNPSLTCLLLCTMPSSPINGGSRWLYYYYNLNIYTSHLNGRNFQFLDGHVSYHNKEYPPTSSLTTFWQGWQ